MGEIETVHMTSDMVWWDGLCFTRAWQACLLQTMCPTATAWSAIGLWADHKRTTWMGWFLTHSYLKIDRF